MYRFTSNAIDLNELRARLCKMNDADLLRFGNAAKFMCSPRANFNEPPRESFVIQLKEARAEWERRKSWKPFGPSAAEMNNHIMRARAQSNSSRSYGGAYPKSYSESSPGACRLIVSQGCVKSICFTRKGLWCIRCHSGGQIENPGTLVSRCCSSQRGERLG